MTDQEVRAHAEFLIGKANDPDIYDFLHACTPSQTDLFDTIVFTCSCCGWWCSTDKQNDGPYGEYVCDECLTSNPL